MTDCFNHSCPFRVNETRMKEYIERAAVKDEILSWAVCINHPELLSKEDTMYCIDSIPATDVVEVRHGRWKNGGNGLYDTCTACGEEIYLAIPMNYCPLCGARMDKED